MYGILGGSVLSSITMARVRFGPLVSRVDNYLAQAGAQLDREQDFLASATMRHGEGHELSHWAFRGLSLLRGDLAQPPLAEVWELTSGGTLGLRPLGPKVSPILAASAVAVRQSGFARAWRQQCASGLLAEALWGASPSGASASRPASAYPAKLCTRPDSRFGTSRARRSLTMRG